MPRDVLATVLFFAADNAPSTDSSTAIVLAIIGGLVTVVVALIGLVGTRLAGRAPKPADPAPPAPSAVDHEAALERFLMRQGFDPNKIVTGDEWPHEARFF